MLAPGATWPLVGRVEELEQIVRARRRRGLVLSAGAGVGKSRLAHEASRVAAEDGALVGSTSRAAG
jgi:ATP/maltotriose-dependent transcriptional regulator MalT